MSLDLNKYREASHTHIAVAGSYTDTFIEAQGKSSTSSSQSAFVRWVPNNPEAWMEGDNEVETGTIDNNLEEEGYLEWNPPAAGAYHLLTFQYYGDANYSYDGSSTSPGIALIDIDSFPSNSFGTSSMASRIGQFLGSSTGDGQIMVIINTDSISSGTSLHSQMLAARSWRHEVTIANNTQPKTYSYAACLTNIGSIGMLAESLGGWKSHDNASIELAIEHTLENIGHAGYGMDMASGMGNGNEFLDMSDGTYNTFIDSQGNGGTDQYHKVSGKEYVRATWEAKLGQGAVYWGGNIRLRMKYQNSTGTVTTANVINSTDSQQSTDLWTKNELLIEKPNNSDRYLTISLEVSAGSGVGQGYDSYNAIDVRNLEVYKAGLGPDEARAIAVHKWHINALNVIESPGDFKMGKLSSFKEFFEGDRNLLGSSHTYSLNTSYGNSSECQSAQATNTSVDTGDPQSRYNYPRFQATNYPSANNNQTHYWTRDVWSATANHSTTTYLGNGSTIDHTKIYMSGIWVRVRANNHTNTGLAPNRISLCATGKTAAGGTVSFGGGATIPTGHSHAFQSVYAGQFGLTADRQEWKLMTGVYLPSWMGNTDVSNWIENYWANWSEYEWDEDAKGSGITGYGIENVTLGQVAVMTTATATIRTKVLVEQYQSTDMWAEFMYPFLIEIDPANFTEEGNAFFWDFTEV